MLRSDPPTDAGASLPAQILKFARALPADIVVMAPAEADRPDRPIGYVSPVVAARSMVATSRETGLFRRIVCEVVERACRTTGESSRAVVSRYQPAGTRRMPNRVLALLSQECRSLTIRDDSHWVRLLPEVLRMPRHHGRTAHPDDLHCGGRLRGNSRGHRTENCSTDGPVPVGAEDDQVSPPFVRLLHNGLVRHAFSYFRCHPNPWGHLSDMLGRRFQQFRGNTLLIPQT